MSNGHAIEKKRCSAVSSFFKSVFFIDFIKGLSVTLKYTFDKPITMRYPDEEKWIPYKRFRGQHTLNRNAEGKELCVGCELCAKSCPTNCITVIPMEDGTGKGIADRVAKVWRVNLVRCMYCGFCEDACPTEALKLGREYELACFTLEHTLKDKSQLLKGSARDPSAKKEEIPDDFEGGVIAKARLEITEEGQRVIPDLSKTKVWW